MLLTLMHVNITLKYEQHYNNQLLGSWMSHAPDKSWWLTYTESHPRCMPAFERAILSWTSASNSHLFAAVIIFASRDKASQATQDHWFKKCQGETKIDSREIWSCQPEWLDLVHSLYSSALEDAYSDARATPRLAAVEENKKCLQLDSVTARAK